MSTSKLALALPLALALVPTRASAHPSITTGDIAIVSIWTEPAGPISFSFVTLATFHPPEVVFFTDRGWTAAGSFRPGEGQTRWDVERPSDPGTVVFMDGDTGVHLAPGADQLFGFLGELDADGRPTDSLLYGIALGSPWGADATSDATSALPAALAMFNVALPATPGPALNCAFAGRTSGTRTQLLLAIADPTQWTCDDSARPAPPAAFTVFAATGDPCSTDTDCTGGDFCAHSVCCTSECRRAEAGHCETCSFGLGDPRTGTCGPAPTTQLCRLATGPCDPMDHCDGTSRLCPPNELLGAETVCRESAGGCDPEEHCDGVVGACPTDRRAEIGSLCRPSRGSCDVEERCGEGPTCPADAVVEEGSACDDGLVCTERSMCRAGLCTGPVPVECEDGDACTADSCADTGGCAHIAIMGCCEDDADCEDGDPCTAHTCDPEGWCVAVGAALCVDAGTTSADGGARPPPAPPVGCGCSTHTGARDGAVLMALLLLTLRIRDRARAGR
ncbi:MAG TPA: hypothetical protein ENK57_11430 [Polyangiaceae bacterium]|nr:hypothetical protein [Polyangiaceae bacterium]